jgi:hypothetical protein
MRLEDLILMLRIKKNNKLSLRVNDIKQEVKSHNKNQKKITFNEGEKSRKKVQ